MNQNQGLSILAIYLSEFWRWTCNFSAKIHSLHPENSRMQYDSNELFICTAVRRLVLCETNVEKIAFKSQRYSIDEVLALHCFIQSSTFWWFFFLHSAILFPFEYNELLHFIVFIYNYFFPLKSDKILNLILCNEMKPRCNRQKMKTR